MEKLEYLGAITGFLCVWLATKRHVLNWPFAIVSSLCYFAVFFNVKLYVDTALQVFFVGSSIYGWIYWKKSAGNKEVSIVNINKKQLVFYLVVTVLCSLFLGFGLSKYTDAAIPYFDSFSGCFSILAQWFLARKHIENWIIWIVVDVVYVGMYLYRELFPTAILYTAFLVLAIMGYIKWKQANSYKAVLL